MSYVVLCRVGGDFTLTATCKEELRSKAAAGGDGAGGARLSAACGGGQTGDLTIISAGADLADTAFYLSHTRRSHFTATVN